MRSDRMVNVRMEACPKSNEFKRGKVGGSELASKHGPIVPSEDFTEETIFKKELSYMDIKVSSKSENLCVIINMIL